MDNDKINTIIMLLEDDLKSFNSLAEGNSSNSKMSSFYRGAVASLELLYLQIKSEL